MLVCRTNYMKHHICNYGILSSAMLHVVILQLWHLEGQSSTFYSIIFCSFKHTSENPSSSDSGMLTTGNQANHYINIVSKAKSAECPLNMHKRWRGVKFLHSRSGIVSETSVIDYSSNYYVLTLSQLAYSWSNRSWMKWDQIQEADELSEN